MLNVVKASGVVEPFSDEKVLSSIKRAGIPKELQSKVLAHIKQKAFPNITTKEIYQHILEYLDKSETPFAKTRYSLKDAIMQLGPTGYPFEDFIAKLLTEQGYHTSTRQTLKGRCITHEIDIIAAKNGKTASIEAKFHNNHGTRTEVQVALYTKSRFDDIKEYNTLDEAWIITNTKITQDAIGFAGCSKMKVISWNYPAGNSLRDIIEKTGLHPITALSSLTANHKKKLLDNHIVICKDICRNSYLLNMLNLTKKEKARVLDEIEYTCKLKVEDRPKPAINKPHNYIFTSPTTPSV